TLAVGKLGVLFLQPGAVQQDQLGHIPGGPAGIDFALEAVQQQPGQVATVVQVGVGQHHRIDAVRVDRQASPVQLTQVLQPLEQAAIDHDAGVIVGQQVFRAGYGSGATKTGQCQ